MAVTLAIFAAVQIAMPLWIRPNLFPARPHGHPGHLAGRHLAQQAGLNGSRFHARHPEPPRPARRLAPVQRSRQRRRAASQHHPGRLHHAIDRKRQPRLPYCLASHGIREAVSYQPASRYWAFQWTETAIYLALALALAGYCFRRLGRRLS